MNILIDTNILLDVLAAREPFYAAAAAIWSLAERREVQAYVSAISFNNVYYVIRKIGGKEKAEKAMRLMRDTFGIIAPDAQIIAQAIDASCDDFEDAVQLYSAVRAKANCLVTRNPGDYPCGDPAILMPEEFLALWRDHRRAR